MIFPKLSLRPKFSLFATILLFLACQPSATVDNRIEPPPDTDDLLKFMATEADSLSEFVDPHALALSNRLGIRYSGARHKFLIQQRLPKELINSYRRKTLEKRIEVLDDGFARMELNNVGADSAEYYLRNGRLTSPMFYHTRNWPRKDAGYFRFVMSDSNLLTNDAVEQLNAFVDECAELLGIDSPSLQQLKQKKIYYYLCSGPEEINQLTGFHVRGIYDLAYDHIVSSFNSHTHEVAHLLINYRLKDLPLYTHPFLQEGFACAVGGRGGKTARIINNLGAFLQLSKFVNYKELLTVKGFQNPDGSLAYPLAGIYNLYLLEVFGVEKYLEFYKRKSGPGAALNSKNILSRELPDSSAFAEFAGNYFAHRKLIMQLEEVHEKRTLLSGEWGSVAETDSSYVFHLKQSIRLLPPNPKTDFVSIEFREIFPETAYQGEQYVLEVKEAEVKLFNFYTMKLEAFYSRGLALEPYVVQQANGEYAFAIRRSVFRQPLQDYRILAP